MEVVYSKSLFTDENKAETFVKRYVAQAAFAEKIGAVNTQTVSTDNGILREFNTLRGQISYFKYSENYFSNSSKNKPYAKSYHHMEPAVKVNPGNTVPPITRPKGYLWLMNAIYYSDVNL